VSDTEEFVSLHNQTFVSFREERAAVPQLDGGNDTSFEVEGKFSDMIITRTFS